MKNSTKVVIDLNLPSVSRWWEKGRTNKSGESGARFWMGNGLFDKQAGKRAMLPRVI